MFYYKEEKELLGRYFKYYREQNNMSIKDITSTGLCDFKTYKRVENGFIKNNEELYDNLLSLYNLDYEYINILKEVKPFVGKLYDACEWYDQIKIKNLSQRIQNKLYHIKDRPLIKELMVSIDIIRNFYVNKINLTENEILETIPLIMLWNNELSSLLIEVCENSNLKDVISIDVTNLLKKHITKVDNIQKYWYARECIMNMNYNEALEIYNQLEKIFTESNNIQRNINVLLKQFLIYRDIDYNKANEYAIVLSNLLNDSNITLDKKSKIYTHLAIYYYLRNNYEESLECFEKSNELKLSMRNIFFICACRSRLGKVLNFQFEIDTNHTLYEYLHYFKMKSNNESYQNLENYIMKTLLAKLKNDRYEEPFWNLFDYEMSVLVKHTRNYKKYHEFHEILQFTTKNAA